MLFVHLRERKTEDVVKKKDVDGNKKKKNI